MNATEDGTEPLGESPDITTHNPTVINGFTNQDIPVSIDGTRRIMRVPAQLTQCPHLVITPSVGTSHDGRTIRLRGTLALTHTGTGALIVESTYVAGLEKLAAALKDFDWDFDARNHFVKPENAELADAIRATIRSWQTDEGYSGPVSMWGDDDEKRAAREREPATTFLREQLGWWPAHYKSIHDRNLLNTNRDAWQAEISSSVNGWGMTYLLAVLQRLSPQIADVAARRLVAEFDSGDGLGEWIFQWALELDSGEPLTLNGIPDLDPLAQFSVGA